MAAVRHASSVARFPRRGLNRPRSLGKGTSCPDANRRAATSTGWLCIDKAVGQTSTAGVASVKRTVRRAEGRARRHPRSARLRRAADRARRGDQDRALRPGRRASSTASPSRWGVETDTDDADGKVIADVGPRPSRDAIEAELPGFTGEIMQRPPVFSAIKIDGERAYDLAREGEKVDTRRAPGVDPSPGAGRDAGRRPCRARGRMRQGHLRPRACPRPRPPARLPAAMSSALRRLSVGPFDAIDMIPLAALITAREEGPAAASTAS